ncbi:serine/threonine-protein kinase [Granulicella arctica]|uniref:Serine/threonine-protein kinase n=1 Tax=Granulicella arctica TaxID=940613 RepID=A0A7Y9PFD2_9BACT|nr:serine/threonine-protein kinase [Granulicella arctica]NYF78659.1 serine/threonine-protein kinase [Granulicella arctica]
MIDTATQPAEIPLDTQDIAARLSILLAGRYLVLRLIGIGGMASVYLVRHRIHHGLFAVKVLHPALAEQPELLARFRREGLLCARLAGHPNIAPVLDIGEGDGLHYLLMPYIRGEDLDHLLARTGPFSFHDAMLATIQVNEALLYAWNNGVLHCDLTPGNIRLNEFGQFILVDFGLASTSLSPKHPVLPPTTTPRPGTPLYMSPERILNEPIDIRSDLYALGAILYELLTGEAAFRPGIGNSEDTIAQIERNHLSPSRSLAHPLLRKHPGIQPLLQSLLALSPAERFADPIKLQQALRTLTHYPPAPSLHPEIESEPQPTPPRRRLSFR